MTAQPGSLAEIRRAALLFSGGPAPAANAVISTAAASFLQHGIEVVGALNGYSNLMEYRPDRPLVDGTDYLTLDYARLRRTRNSRGILIGTARANPGKLVQAPDHLQDPERTAPLQTVYDALRSIGVDALVSIGGDDTLKTANKFQRFQENLPEGAPRIRVVHVPKTIDNDYTGIDYTFGYFTAVETLASLIRNLLADAEANRSYFLAETMGRYAGWLAYGAAIASEASLVISVEDMVGDCVEDETVTNPVTGETTTRKVMNTDAVVGRIIGTILAREKDGKHFGVIVLAEGLAEYLPAKMLEGIPRDDHGHISIAQVDLGKNLGKVLADTYRERTGTKKKITPIQLGYEARCAAPHAFDVILGSSLGVGAFRALCERGLDGVMISVSGHFELQYVPFHELVDPSTLVTRVRYIDLASDFHRLARFLEIVSTPSLAEFEDHFPDNAQ